VRRLSRQSQTSLFNERKMGLRWMCVLNDLVSNLPQK
jgi:hypothetical protein